MNKTKTDVFLSSKAKSVRLGLYKHYKGKKYQVIGVAVNSETLEEYVVYIALYKKKLMWIRPLSMFMNTVNINGKTMRRFTYVRNEL